MLQIVSFFRAVEEIVLQSILQIFSFEKSFFSYRIIKYYYVNIIRYVYTLHIFENESFYYFFCWVFYRSIFHEKRDSYKKFLIKKLKIN